MNRSTAIDRRRPFPPVICFILHPSTLIPPFSALARGRTRNAAFEAPHDLRFTTRALVFLLAPRFWLLASLANVPGRTRTSTPELEAPNDLPFHHEDSITLASPVE